MIWPDITVVIVTYNRPEEIRKTINALHNHIKYSGQINWLVADDGSDGTYASDLIKDYTGIGLQVVITNRGGWGKNVNNAFKMVDTDYVFLCEDDYVSKYPLDLDTGVTLMQEEPTIGLVRYDGVGEHLLDLSLNTVESSQGKIAYALLRNTSSTLHIYSNRPHLCHKRFHQYYGAYPERQ